MGQFVSLLTKLKQSQYRGYHGQSHFDVPVGPGVPVPQGHIPGEGGKVPRIGTHLQTADRTESGSSEVPWQPG